MTDKEHLEMAAKAGDVGILTWSKDGKKLFFRKGGEQKPWNPLENDGDALRLAVKLNLMITIANGTSYADHYEDICPNIAEPQHIDPFAATRRAIVRAAAAIGKGMK